MVPWMLGGVVAALLLVVGVPLCLFGGFLAWYLLEPNEFTVTNHHPEEIHDVRLIAVRGKSHTELLVEREVLAPGEIWSWNRSRHDGYQLRVEYDGPDGQVIHDRVFWIDSDEIGDMPAHLGGPNAPYAR